MQLRAFTYSNVKTMKFRAAGSAKTLYIYNSCLILFTDFTTEGRPYLEAKMEGNFERLVLKTPPYYYMMVTLDLFGAKANFDSDLFKSVILKALQGVHGDVGASIAVDIIKFDKKSLQAIIRVPSKGLVKVWSAMTLYSSHNEKPCHFKISKVSPHLPSLSVNSRKFTSDLLKK